MPAVTSQDMPGGVTHRDHPRLPQPEPGWLADRLAAITVSEQFADRRAEPARQLDLKALRGDKEGRCWLAYLTSTRICSSH